MKASLQYPMPEERQRRIQAGLFRGGALTLDSPAYLGVLRSLLDALLEPDLAPRDLTVAALGLKNRRACASVVAREPGVAAGLDEYSYLLRQRGIKVTLKKEDGGEFETGGVLLRAEGAEGKLLSLERVGLNLLQRLCGIATLTRRLQERARRQCPATRIVGTRKTPWGLLDKRAIHLGGGGTHRLGLGDAILIKNNHLALLAPKEEQSAPLALERAWKFRRRAAFIEVEVRSEDGALAAARAFKRLRAEAPSANRDYPCLVMLDNMLPHDVRQIIVSLRREKVWGDTLVEASGGITELNVELYAATEVDAISLGALTHSPRALDLCQSIA
ncbi:MAG: carboxylating nicotinate-nucleotide diphosphorylase [Candidatus Acidiferrales bacterium]